MFLSRKTCVVSVPKCHFFSLARAETGARGKLSYGGEAREKTKARVFIPTFPDFTRKWYTFSLFQSVGLSVVSGGEQFSGRRAN